MTDCDRTKTHFSEYIEKSLAPQARKEVKDHLAECKDCKLIFEQIPQIKTILQNLNAIKCSDNFNLKLRQRLADEKNEPFISGINIRRLSYGFSFAAILFLVFFGINMFSGTDSEISNPLPKVENQGINTMPANPNQLVNHSANKFDPAEELEVKTKNVDGSLSDSTKERKKQQNDPPVKYVDTK